MLTFFLVCSSEKHSHLYDVDYKWKQDHGNRDRDGVVWQRRRSGVGDTTSGSIGGYTHE